MPDRAKVIEALTRCEHDECEGCPYDGVCVLRPYAVDRDAVELLKEQEPMKPEFRRGIPSCGKCGNVLANHYRNCPWCGCEVKWDA